MKRAVSLIIILITDISALILSFYAAYFLRVRVIQDLFHVTNPWFFPLEHFYKMYYLLAVFILIFSYERLYSFNWRTDFFEEFVFIVRGLFMSVILIAVIIYLSRSYENFTRTIPILMMLTGIVFVPLLRWMVKKCLTAVGLYVRYTVVIGLNAETKRVMPALKKLEARGSKIVAVLEPGQEDQLDRLLQEKSVETLILIAKGIESSRQDVLINRWEDRLKEIKILSVSGSLKTIGVETEYVDQFLVMRMANNLLSPVNRFLKRLFDLVISFIALVILMPLFLLIALAVKLDSRGPVLFIQERFGKQGKKFRFIKFRTMRVDGDKILENFLAENPQYREEWQRYKKLKTLDPRVTRIGRFLRRFSLDEAPQLINVFKGDMSIVGPRPYLIREKEAIRQSAAIIFRVKSGLTGLWQIKGRSELSFDARLELDEFYVRNWSFLLDITIILKTFGAVLKGKGAY